jgi:3-oxoacyl-[acyl-carrier protein] reductase
MRGAALNSRTILVTGASGGIGTALCERLAAAGHRLILTARDEVRLKQLIAKLPQNTAPHVSIPSDMSKENAIVKFGDEMMRHEINLDGAVLMPPQPHRSNDPMPSAEVWQELFNESFIGPLAMLKAAIAHMHPNVEAGLRCKIVIVSGISSAQVLSHYATANVIRCAWVAQAKTLAFALGPRGIHINTLSLGGTLSKWYEDTVRARAAKAGKTFEEFLLEDTANVPLRKYGQPNEAAAAIEGLLSPFTDHMTGLNIMHDGGFTRAY